MELKGKISIARSTGGGEHYISIQLTDEASGIQFAAVEMSLEDFGGAVTGLSFQPCKIDLRGLQNVGKIRQVKREHIEVDRSFFGLVKEEAKAIVAPYEVDGWRAHLEDVTNHHNWSGSKVKVTFVRWVDAEEEQGDRG